MRCTLARRKKDERRYASVRSGSHAAVACERIFRYGRAETVSTAHPRPGPKMTDDLESVERAEFGKSGTAFDAAEPTPEAALIAKADAARLERAIEQLPPPFRETLVLRDLQGLDYKEIAGVTGVPIGTVMSRLARARRRLMTLIGKDEP